MNLTTPLGFRDILSDEAIEREKLQRDVATFFAESGYRPIETPTLESLDVLSAGAKVPSSPFRFFDSQGDLLAMRPDVTMQIARMCATRIPDSAFPLKLRYTQRVFRENDDASSSNAREITQIGVESIGEDGWEVDLELISMFVKALNICGVNDIVLTLATVAPLRALLDRSGGSDEWKDSVLSAYHESDFVELDRLCNLDDEQVATLAGGVAPAYAKACKDLARVRGGFDAIEEARRITSPLGCDRELDELARIYERFEAAETKAKALVDFSSVSSFDYYTGIVFEVYSPFLGSSIGSGGRYNKMLAAFGKSRPAAGFAFSLEQVIAAQAAEEAHSSNTSNARPLRIAVPKGALNKDAVVSLKDAGLDVDGLDDPGRQLVIRTSNAENLIVRPSDAPAFVAHGAADCGICGRDSLLESGAQVVELVDLKFGGCRFVVAEPAGSTDAINERLRRLGSIRVATKYPKITLAHYAKGGVQVEIVQLHGNIELAPLTGMAERIVDITATGTTLRENDLEIVEDVLDSTARFFANPCAFRCNDEVVELAKKLMSNAQDAHFDPIAGGTA